MNEVLSDQIELNSLVMIGNKRKYLDRVNQQQADHIARQNAAVSQGSNGPMPGAAATDTEDGIINRSPTTNYHYYNAPAATVAPQPQPTPPTTTPAGSKLPKWLLPAAIALLLATGAGGAAWWLTARPSPPSQQKPPNYSPDTTIKFS